MAKDEWHRLPPATRNVFRELLHDELLFESAVTGKMQDKAAVLQASSRRSKYEGRRWRPDQNYVRRARQLREGGVLPSSSVKMETYAQKAQRVARAHSLIGVTSEVRGKSDVRQGQQQQRSAVVIDLGLSLPLSPSHC